MRVIVVGGGWSGLAAAVELSRRSVAVTLLEAADRLGGRAARIRHRGRDYDSGHHLLIGAYRGVRELLDVMGVPEREVFERRPLELISLSATAAPLRLRLADLPAPFHLLGGLLRAEGLSRADKWRALKFCLAAARSRTPDPDYPVLELLFRHAQSSVLIARLWEPVCLATLNTPLHEASAALFLRVLRDTFAYDRRDSDLLLPRRGLASVLPDPAQRFLTARGARILLRHRAAGLEVAHGRVNAVVLADGSRIAADHVVLALPPAACVRLIGDCAPLRPLAARLSRIDHAPICTVYLRYPPAVRLDFPMIGLHGTHAQWVFDLAASGEPGLMAAVISGPGDHASLARPELQERVRAELAARFPHWPAPSEMFSLCEQRATFLSRVGIEGLRPAAETAVEGCWLAGDAVTSGYPATLEGAVRNGLTCARGILREAQ